MCKYDPTPFEANWYVVAFIDVLGQRDLLRQLRILPNRDHVNQMDDFSKVMRQTLGTVLEARGLFIQQYGKCNSTPAAPENLNCEQRNLYLQARSNPLKVQMFSDSVVLYLSLRDDTNRVPMRGVHWALNCCGMAFLAMLANGHPLRGGIDIGIGVEPADGGIYGAALCRAYDLECRAAWYPRVVVGDQLISYLRDQNARTEEDVHSRLNKDLAGLCFDLVCKDDDGIMFLDYLGDGFFPGKTLACEARKMVLRARDVVLKECARYQNCRNGDLAFRYMALRNYFEHSLQRWGIDPGEGQG